MSEPSAPLARCYPAGELPAGLTDLPDPPAALFVTGTWPASPLVAIVGSRAATDYGRAFTRRLAGDLARLGYAVVSGLARGIDAAAHEAALDSGGVTMAVLPGSLDRVTPASHADLARRIARDGALVAEWEAGVPVSRGSFLRRNRLIAAVAGVTVVVEAAAQSGALATAAVAFRLNRPVLAVPGDVDRVTSRGCNALLRRGARVCEDAADVLEALGAVAPARADSEPRLAGAAVTRIEPSCALAPRVAAALDAVPRALEGVAQRAGGPPEQVLATLLELEWAGIARAHPGPRWTARPSAVTP